jgi:hypothetical protein
MAHLYIMLESRALVHTEKEATKVKSATIATILVVLGFVIPVAPVLSAELSLSISSAPKVAKEQIRDLVGKEDFFLLDVRPNEQWRATPVKLPGAVHEDPEDVAAWAYRYPKGAKIVTY